MTANVMISKEVKGDCNICNIGLNPRCGCGNMRSLKVRGLYIYRKGMIIQVNNLCPLNRPMSVDFDSPIEDGWSAPDPETSVHFFAHPFEVQIVLVWLTVVLYLVLFKVFLLSPSSLPSLSLSLL